MLELVAKKSKLEQKNLKMTENLEQLQQLLSDAEQWRAQVQQQAAVKEELLKAQNADIAQLQQSLALLTEKSSNERAAAGPCSAALAAAGTPT